MKVISQFQLFGLHETVAGKIHRAADSEFTFKLEWQIARLHGIKLFLADSGRRLIAGIQRLQFIFERRRFRDCKACPPKADR